MNILTFQDVKKLQPGAVKNMIWRHRHRISQNHRVLYEKYSEVVRYLMRQGYSVFEARYLSFVYLSFPYFRTLTFMNQDELLLALSDVKDIILMYDNFCN